MHIHRRAQVVAVALAVAAGWSGAGVAQAGTRAPKRVAAARHGGAVVVTWSRVARAQTYTVRASTSDGQRLVHTAYGTDLHAWRFRVASRYRVAVRVCAATGASTGCDGPWRSVRLRPHQRRARS
jgi:hypothetical protein